jgi:Fe2+ transport system protein B
MGKSEKSTVELQKKRQMRNNRKKRRRQQRAMIKSAVASEPVAVKIAESVRQQKLIAENYCAKWRKLCQETKARRAQHIKQVIIEQIMAQYFLLIVLYTIDLH